MVFVIRSEPIPGNCYFWSAPDQPFVLPVRVREFGKSSKTAHTAMQQTKSQVDRVVVSEGEAALEPLVLSVLGSHPGVWLYPVPACDGKSTGSPAEVAFAFDYLMSGVAGRLREFPASIPADDPSAWLQHELPSRIEQVLAKLGARPGFAALASSTRNVWVISVRFIRLTGGKQLRSEAVEIHRSV